MRKDGCTKMAKEHQGRPLRLFGLAVGFWLLVLVSVATAEPHERKKSEIGHSGYTAVGVSQASASDPPRRRPNRRPVPKQTKEIQICLELQPEPDSSQGPQFADIFLDGALVSTVSEGEDASFDVEVGNHEIAVRLEGYSEEKKQIQALPGKTQKFCFSLRKNVGPADE